MTAVHTQLTEISTTNQKCVLFYHADIQSVDELKHRLILVWCNLNQDIIDTVNIIMLPPHRAEALSDAFV